MLWSELVDRLQGLIGQADGHSPGDIVLIRSRVLQELTQLLLDATEFDLRPHQGLGKLGDQEASKRRS